MAPGVEACREAYRDLVRTARRCTRSADEARDLAQDALLVALARGIDDWASPSRRPWLRGVVRKRAAFLARGEVRRRRREELAAAALGLELAAQEGYLLGTLPGGTELLFFEGEAVRGTSPQIVFGLDEGGIDTVAEQLAARGVQLMTPVTEAPGGWSFEFKDPDDHPLAFYQAEALPRKR